MADCKFEYDEGVLIALPSGDIDHHNAKALRESIDSNIYLYRASTVILDLSKVEFMDSSGLGLILGRYAKIRELGGKLIIADPTPATERILKLAGTEKMITVKNTKGAENEKVTK